MDDPIRLQIVRADGREIVCDEQGRPLADVKDVQYSSYHDDIGTLTVTVAVKRPRWDQSLGKCQIQGHPSSQRTMPAAEYDSSLPEARF